MALVKYRRPFGLLDSVFEDWNAGLFPALSGWRGAEVANEEALRLPRTNVEEEDGSYVFTMEMPGLSRKDIEVSIEKDTLTVKGEKMDKSEKKDGNGFLRREIRSSKFERSFSLGEVVDQENIRAKMVEGVLTITVPKKGDTVGRKVNVD
jgi:HSP20 family protein